ncbi:MAG: glycosyltransferase [Candidatus Aenigmatarchaeota archaeon]
MKSLSDYRVHVPEPKISKIYQKATDIAGSHIINVNATYYGGGVAEMMRSVVPLMNDIGINAGWRSIVGSHDFFQVTKKFHNALQGDDKINLSEMKKKAYETTNVEFARFTHVDHDLVVVHDPQPLPLIQFYDKHQPWVWRCHIDLSDPNPEIWDYLRSFVLKYDRLIYQMEEFAAEGMKNTRMIHPAIDPLTTKNKNLADEDLRKKLEDAGIDPDRPFIAQISRYDKWKDPTGVIEIYKRLKELDADCQLAMVGGMASDDPEGQEVFREVKKAAEGLEDVNLIVDAPDILVNAVQTGADVVLQMSKREGFGLTATEAMWKRSPVVATDVGGLKLQVQDGNTGYIVEPEDYDSAARKVAKLLDNENKRRKMGQRARERVRNNFLITRLIEDWVNVYRDLLLNNH